jgi:hypothetical protein
MLTLYKITNLGNNKVYIGQTSNTLEYRWQLHLQAVLDGSRFYIHNAIRKYGVECWKIESIGVYLTEEELDRAEELAIYLHDSRNKEKGYNLTGGSDRPQRH